MIVRLGWRKTGWNRRNLAEVLKTDFTRKGAPDLSPSFYQADTPARLSQIVSEHYAAKNHGSIPDQVLCFDVTALVMAVHKSGNGQLRSTPTPQQFFTYTLVNHLELDFGSSLHTRDTFVQAILTSLGQSSSIRYSVTDFDIEAYFKPRVLTDPEWRSLAQFCTLPAARGRDPQVASAAWHREGREPLAFAGGAAVRPVGD